MLRSFSAFWLDLVLCSYFLQSWGPLQTPKIFFHRQNIFIERLERRMHRKRKRVTIQEMDVNKVFADIEAIAADANPPEDSS